MWGAYFLIDFLPFVGREEVVLRLSRHGLRSILQQSFQQGDVCIAADYARRVAAAVDVMVDFELQLAVVVLRRVYRTIRENGRRFPGAFVRQPVCGEFHLSALHYDVCAALDIGESDLLRVGDSRARHDDGVRRVAPSSSEDVVHDISFAYIDEGVAIHRTVLTTAVDAVPDVRHAWRVSQSFGTRCHLFCRSRVDGGAVICAVGISHCRQVDDEAGVSIYSAEFLIAPCAGVVGDGAFFLASALASGEDLREHRCATDVDRRGELLSVIRRICCILFLVSNLRRADIGDVATAIDVSEDESALDVLLIYGECLAIDMHLCLACHACHVGEVDVRRAVVVRIDALHSGSSSEDILRDNSRLDEHTRAASDTSEVVCSGVGGVCLLRLEIRFRSEAAAEDVPA